VSPAGLRRTIIIAAFICLAGLVSAHYLAQRFQSAAGSRPSQEPEIPLYPEARNISRQRQAVLGWQGLTFQVNYNYPSTKVFDYYRVLLESQGYRPIPPDQQPVWQPADVTKESRKLVMAGDWVDAEGLRVLQLKVSVTEEFMHDPETGRLLSQRTLPGQNLQITLSRKVFLPSEEK
jgi:hypothetical protein